MQGKFSLSEFKKWVKTHPESGDEEEHKNHLVGAIVESKISAKKLIDKIIIDDESKLEEIANCFFNDGGTIKEIDGKNLLIEVKSGEFTVNKFFVKKTV